MKSKKKVVKSSLNKVIKSSKSEINIAAKKGEWKKLIQSGNVQNRKEARKEIKKQMRLGKFSKKAPTQKKVIQKSLNHTSNTPSIQDKSQISKTKKNLKSNKVSQKVNTNSRKEGSSGGIVFSNDVSERMKKFQEYINRTTKQEGNKKSKKVNEDKKEKKSNGNLIKDKQKLMQLREDKVSDEKEIKKIGKLLTRSNRKFRIQGFDDDFGSLLEDIDEGTMDHVKEYVDGSILKENGADDVTDILKNLVDLEVSKRLDTKKYCEIENKVTKNKKREFVVSAEKSSDKLKVSSKKRSLGESTLNLDGKSSRVKFSSSLSVRHYDPSCNLNSDDNFEMDCSEDDEYGDEESIESLEDADSGSEISGNDQNSDNLESSDNDSDAITDDESVEDVELSHDIEDSPNESIRVDHTEDIYGRTIDEDGNVMNECNSLVDDNAYVPPALRKKTGFISDEKKEEQAFIRRKITSLLAKVTDQNMASILKDMELMYTKFSHNDLNEILFSELYGVLVRPTMPTNTTVQDLAFLVSTLSANSGSEIGSHVMTEFVCSFVSKMAEYKESDQEDLDCKELDNIVTFVSQLFNFRVVVPGLMFDIMMKLANELGSKEVDLILLILKNIGFTLRKMDPVGLKKFILLVQEKVSSLNSEEKYSNSRFSFMLSILKAIKNNDVSKIPDYDTKHVEELKSMSKSLVKQGRLHPELNVTLKDIMNANSSGRWWVVGSAWSGQNDNVEEEKLVSEELADPAFNQFRIKAEKLKLSRPPLINIFYILTEGSIDATDSVQKLINLKLDKSKLPQIFNVLVFCVQKASFYDTFFHEVATQLCCYDKKFKWLLKKAIWAKFADIETMKNKHISYLGQFVANLISKKVLDITLFKLLPLNVPTEKLVKFFRHCILTIIFSELGKINIIDIVLPLWNSKNVTLRKRLLVFIKICIVPKITKEHKKDLALFMHLLTKQPEMSSDSNL